MLRLVDIPSARAEAATYEVNGILADYRVRRAAVAESSPQAQDAARDAIFRLVATAEMFAGEHLLDMAEQQLPAHELVMRVWEERTPRILRDWTNRRSAWKELFDVKWSYRNWNELQGFLTARNIIAHGLGRLTRSQLRRGKIRSGVLGQLGAAGLRLDGHRLILDDSGVERCGRRVKHFIAWLDDASKI